MGGIRSELNEVQLESAVVYDGKVVRLECDRVRLPDGTETVREVVRHRGAVAVAAVEDNEYIWLVRQYRYAPGSELLELPAGKLEPGEDAVQTARRELLEEVGLCAEKWTRLTAFFTSPGFSDEKLILYQAEGLTEVPPGERPPVEGEFVRRERWPFTRALEAVLQGEFQDAKTVSGILLVAQMRLASGEVTP